MKEEIIISGRLNPGIDPVLHIWHWQIPLYLFLGGLAAGVLFFAALYTILGKEDKYAGAVKYAPFIAPFALVLGLIALFLDLKHQLYFWRLYTTIRIMSPMSWGAWTLLAITPLSFVWAALNIRIVFPRWEWKWKILVELENFFLEYKRVLAWLILVLSLILGIYTGILFSAFNARPLWNTSILGPLFLTSGLSTGAAVVIIMARSHKERLLFSRIDLILIIIELVLITHMFMGFLASTQVQIDAAKLFLGGPFTAPFWVFVVILGLLVPAILEALELARFRVPAIVPASLVLTGGLVLRFLISNAGQMSRWLY